ncbi:MAG: ACP S-malonyltransferase [Pseudomonadota bacterium]
MTTYLFPGQGSQARGMAAELFDKFPNMTKIASDILGYSIKSLCLEDPKRQLNSTEFTQPALYVANALFYQQALKEAGAPQYVAGHSLGEYNALQAAGVISFEEGVQLVKKRGELMSHAPAGSMAAILGLSYDEVKKYLVDHHLLGIDIANANAPTQIVISGRLDDISAAKNVFEKLAHTGVNYIPLKVSGAFHSRYMIEAQETFEAFLKTFEFSEPQFPVIANITGKPYQYGSVDHMLANQITHSVHWADSMRYMLEQGETEFKEIGPGTVLTKLLNLIRADWDSHKQHNTIATDEREAFIGHIGHIGQETIGATVDPTIGLTTADAQIAEGTLANQNDAAISINMNPENTKLASNSYEEKIVKVKERLEKWNKTYPIGTKVQVKGYSEILETRTLAMMLFGHRAAIYMQGYKGYFALDDVNVVNE